MRLRRLVGDALPGADGPSADAGAGGYMGQTRSGTCWLGVAVNIALLSPGLALATDAARRRRASARRRRCCSAPRRWSRWSRAASVSPRSTST